MPIIDYTEEEPVVPTPPPVTTTPVTQDKVFVDTRYTPVTSLLTHVEGSPIILDAYYSQVLTDSTELSSQQVNQAAVYQQYTKIVNMEMKVTSPLSPSQSADTRSMAMTGTATIFPFLTPNRGDMFVGDIGEGRTGVFTITNTEKKSILTGTCYSVEYTLVDYSANRQVDLDEKTIKTVYYVKERMTFGQRPVLVESELRRYEDLKAARGKLIRTYMQELFSRQFKVLLVPNQSEPTYDPYLTKFINDFIGGDESPYIREIKEYNLAGDDAELVRTLWDVLLSGDRDGLYYVNQKMWTISTGAFRLWPTLQSVYYSELRRVVYPIDQKDVVDHAYRKTPHWVGESLRSTVAQLGLEEKCRKLRPQFNLSPTTTPIFHGVCEDDFYIFSSHFYSGDETQTSIIENHVLSYLEGKFGDIGELLWLCACSQYWSPLERYYFVPVLLVLITSTLERGI